jgi:uncharacterized membrane protein YozB (DUF420 family)
MFDPSTEKLLLIILGIIIGVFIGIILFYSYITSYDMFIASINLLIIVYSSLSITYILQKKNLFNERDYNVQIGSDIFMLVLSCIFLIFFGIKSMFFIRKSY